MLSVAIRTRAFFVRRIACAAFIGIVLFMQRAPSARATNVWTHRYDNRRTGSNPNETELTPEKVRRAFGYRLKLRVDGDVYAQPLLIQDVKIAGVVHQVLIVATEHDSVYAFDADGDVAKPAIWQASFSTTRSVGAIDRMRGSPVVVTGPVPIGHDESPLKDCEDIEPEIGITGTPVVSVDAADPSNSVIYVVAKTKEVAVNGDIAYRQTLHALAITDGSDVVAPRVIEASVEGTGNGGGPNGVDKLTDHESEKGDNDGAGHVVFDALHQNQRAGLLLLNGIVYVAWAAHCDQFPYHGWIIGYDAATLNPRYVFNASPNGGLSGIWQAGGAPAADTEGDIYVITANGPFDPGKRNFGDSVLRLHLEGKTLAVRDYFTPCNELDLRTSDNDLGSWGPLLLADRATSPTHLLIAVGKEGVVYVIDRDRMGRHSIDRDDIVQRLPDYKCPRAPEWNNLFGAAAFLADSAYFLGAPPAALGKRTDYALTKATFVGSQISVVGRSKFNFAASRSKTGPVVSANGSEGVVVWIIELDDPKHPNRPPILHAFDGDLGEELYPNGKNDLPDSNKEHGIKFSVPTVANGRVFVGAASAVYVYGSR